MKLKGITRLLVMGIIPYVMAACTSTVVGGKNSPVTGLLPGENPAIDPGSSPFRRITNLQYKNIVRDVLEIENPPMTGFPADSTSGNGFNNGSVEANLSEQHADAYFIAAKAIAEDAINNKLAQIFSCNVSNTSADTCARKFIATVGEKLYRRPLETVESSQLFDTYKNSSGPLLSGEDAYKTGLIMSLRRMLQSPFFLYRVESSGNEQPGKKTPLTSWEMASRISFFLWNSAPDSELINAAKKDELQTPEVISAQVKRMLEDPRAKETIRDFYTQWLELYRLGQLTKSVTIPNGANWDDIQALMKTEANKLIDEIIWETKNLNEFFTVSHTYLNQPLAAFYGFSGTFDGSFKKYTHENTQIKGVMALGGMMALTAQPTRSSPTKRGNFFYNKLLCQKLPAFPRDVNPVFPMDDPNVVKTTREKAEVFQQTQACKGCHSIMDPIGFAFENFDAIGKWRTEEVGKTVDSSGTLSLGSASGNFNGPAEFGALFVNNEDFARCVPTQMFRYAMGKVNGSVDDAAIDDLKEKFESQDFDLLALIEMLILNDTFRYRKAAS